MAPQTFQLVMRSGPTPGKVYPLSKSENIIGRDTTADIVINDAEVSRKHARLVINAGGFLLEDLGSTNGTFVNGQRLMGPHSLRPGELIMFGENVSLSFEAVQYDPGATMIAGQEQKPANFDIPVPAAPVMAAPPEPPAFNAPPPPPSFTPIPPQPAYGGQMPPAPVEAYPAPAAPPKKGSRTWLFAGCGCLILLFLCSGVGLYVVDTFNMWCTIFGFIIPGCTK